MTRDTLAALIARAETATGPDAELDANIMAALFLREDWHIGTMEEDEDGRWQPVKQPVWVDPETGRWVGTHALPYTASLDAALSLVPEGWSWSAWGADRFTGTRPGAVLADETYKAPEIPWECDRPFIEGAAATPALALTAAALRARLAQMESDDGQ